jgi:hypothetical protein
MKLTISTNFPTVTTAMATMREDIGRQALARAMNRTLDQARTRMQREITSEFNVSAGYVRERLSVRRAFGGGRLEISASLIGGKGSKRSANIIAFVEKSVTLAQARKRAKDGTLQVLRVKVKRGSTKPLPGAFIGNKGRTVFKRVGKKRLPIEAVRTIDVAQMFNTKRINEVVLAAINAKLPEIFEREAAFYLQRFNRG